MGTNLERRVIAMEEQQHSNDSRTWFIPRADKLNQAQLQMFYGVGAGDDVISTSSGPAFWISAEDLPKILKDIEGKTRGLPTAGLQGEGAKRYSKDGPGHRSADRRPGGPLCPGG